MPEIKLMEIELDHLEEQIPGKRNRDSPPLHLWDPELSGDIDIVINADGEWIHQGGKIKRDSIVDLFSRILRRESDGDYYLVTPGEKWRIQVESHPLIVVDVDRHGTGKSQVLIVTLNNGKRLEIDTDHPLSQEPLRERVAVVALEHGLSALFSRAAWYRLAEMIDPQGNLWSAGQCYHLE
ncbi:MAG: hypothetical protein ACJA09_000223 [Alcanivorax sp.]|jgi:hypothetical protein